MAARNLLRATELEHCPLRPDHEPTRKTIRQVRDVLEHWDDNMPAFNAQSRPVDPTRNSGKDLAAEVYTTSTPYDFISWNGQTGAMLAPNLPAAELHELLDQAECAVLDEDPDMSRFIPERAPSPWVWDEALGSWWPRSGLRD